MHVCIYATARNKRNAKRVVVASTKEMAHGHDANMVDV